MNDQRGFGLIELLVAFTIVGFLWGGVKYLKQYGAESGSALNDALEAKQAAEQAKALVESRYQDIATSSADFSY
ncbi:MAG TPA: prepilin-type N-terminal cleavage/methylation domain-containing protein [Candidatus Paceibacterota bacterium]